MSLLTNYRPNFCCQCGSKIVRLRWRWWYSRKFCTPCGSLYRKHRLLEPALGLVAVATVAFGIGRALHPKPPPLFIQRVASIANANGSNTPIAAQTNLVEEEVYICGARTKKGTPCSRRVHGPVRCWQHKGMPAMLAAEKLRVKD